MVSAALQPNLANVSTAFFFCSALYILMVLLVFFRSRISAAAPFDDPIVPCIPLLMATAVLYGISTPWGFAKHGWLVAKWVLAVAVIVSFAILPYSTASVGAALACVIALFTISVYKPDKKKAKAKPEKAKVGKTNNA